MIEIKHQLYRRPADEFEQGGAPEPAAHEAVEPTATVVSESASMFDAITSVTDTPEQKEQRARDAQGRFAAKQEAELQAKAPPALGQKPTTQATPPAGGPNKPTVEDPGQMPEGLTPKAQQRFQALANTAKEATQERDALRGQVDYVKEVFTANGVKPEQFEQATAVIGMMNKGDLEGALRVLDQQREMIALAIGKSLPGVDPLSKHEDLRQAVDNYQITEDRALEIAKLRTMQSQREQQDHHFAQQQQSRAAEEQERSQGVLDIDRLCKRLESSDLDYAHIEEKLLPHLQNLLQGVPPRQWAKIVETQYNMLKQVSGQYRRTSPATGSVLRATGHESPGSAPASMFDAIKARLSGG